jgi:hypothetical protein
MANQSIGDAHIHQWQNYLHMASVLVRKRLEHHCKCCAECNQLMCETTVATTGAAQWYMIPDGLSAAIYDAFDLDGDGPNGHGMVCENAAPSDARLIAASPLLLAAAKAASNYTIYHAEVCPEPETCTEVLVHEQLLAAIAKAEGRA